MRDVIIGSITNYTITQIRPWVESLKQSGFTGNKYMVCYNIDYETVDYLKDNGFILKLFINVPHEKRYTYNFPRNFHICVHRFIDMWDFLNQQPQEIKNEFRFLISTDVGDVIFQSNPSIWLENNLKDKFKINAATESIRYKDEILWGAENIRQSFGNNVYEKIKDNLIYNAGTISGRYQNVIDMFLVIYNMCQGFLTRNPDQAAYNLLLSLEPYKSVTKFNMSEDGWACQLGTTMHLNALQYFEQKLVEPRPVVENGIVCTNKKRKPFVIVHQYNRVPDLVEMINKKYSI